MNFTTLLKLEWLKIQNWQTFYFLIIYILLTTLFTAINFGILGLPPKDGHYIIDIVSLNPFGRLINSFVGNLAFIASLFFIMQSGGEYKHGMVRKSVMDGMSRNDIFTSKMIFMGISYIGWTIVLLLVFIIFGLIRLPGHSSEFLSSIQFTQLIKFIIYLFFYGALSHFLVTITKSSTIAVVILLGAAFVEPLMVIGLRYYEITGIIPYLPFELSGYVRNQDFVATDKIAAFLGYMLVFFGTSHWVIVKRDL